MIVTFYNFSKRENSTKQPTLNDVTISGEVCFKQATSLVSPTIIMAVGNDDVDKAITSNYCEINGKYYYITDKVMMNSSHMSFDCNIDVLASYKSEILNSRLYVKYSTSGNTDTVDDRICATSDIKSTTTFTYMDDLFTDSVGYILEVANKYGFDIPYYMTSGELGLAAQNLVTPDFLEQISQYFSNPMEAILKLQITPITLGNLDNWGSLENIFIGNYDLNASGRRFYSHKYIEKFYEVLVPWNYNDFRNRSPYSQVTMYLPFVGLVTLDTATMYRTKSLNVKVYVEIATGNIVYMIYAELNEEAILISSYTGNCNTLVPIARVQSSNPITSGISAAMVGTGLAIGSPITALMGITGIIDSFKQTTQINGTHSSALDSKLGLRIVTTVWSSKTTEEPTSSIDVRGLPYQRSVLLSELTGYVETIDASVSCSGTLGEIQDINRYLNGGVYIE